MLMLMSEWMMLVLMQCKCQMQCLTLGCYNGAALAVAWSFQAAGCDHLKRLGRVNHRFLSLEDVQGAANDRLCKNVVARFLMKFWIKGEGRALAFDEAVAGTHEVHCGFSLVGFSSFFPFSFYVAYDLVDFVS